MTTARQIARAAAVLLAVGVFVLPPRADAAIPRPELYAAAPLSHSAPLASSQSGLHQSSPAAALTPYETAASAFCRNDPVNNFDPLGLDSITIQDGSVYWAIMQDWNGPYNPEARRVKIGAIADGMVTFSDAFGGGSAGLETLMSYTKRFWERPTSGSVMDPTDISTLGLMTDVQDAIIRDYLQHYVRDYGCLTIGEYRGPFVAKTVGEPGDVEGFVPVWGSGRQAIYDYQTGHPIWGTVNLGLAATDVVPVRSLLGGVLKGAWKKGSKSWKVVKPWYKQTRHLVDGQPVHHWRIPQRSHVSDAFKNNPLNLLPITPPDGLTFKEWHDAIEGKGRFALGPFGRWWHGSPDWALALEFSAGGKTANLSRDDDLTDDNETN